MAKDNSTVSNDFGAIRLVANNDRIPRGNAATMVGSKEGKPVDLYV